MDALRSLFLNNVAEALGIDRTALDSALSTAAASTTDEAVANGTLTQEQADRLEARIQSGDFGFGGGRGGRGGFGGVRINSVRDAIVAAAAQTLNVTEDELQAQLRNGQTLAQIAEAQGTTEQAVIDAVLAAAKTKLDEAVAVETVTQEQADAVYAQLPGARRRFDFWEARRWTAHTGRRSHARHAGRIAGGKHGNGRVSM